MISYKTLCYSRRRNGVTMGVGRIQSLLLSYTGKNVIDALVEDCSSKNNLKNLQPIVEFYIY